MTKEERAIIVERAIPLIDKGYWRRGLCSALYYSAIYNKELDISSLEELKEGKDLGSDWPLYVFPGLREIAIKYNTDFNSIHWWPEKETELRKTILRELLEKYKK